MDILPNAIRPKLFYIDDEPEQHKLLNKIIGEHCDIHFFETSMDAIEALTELKPIIIIYEDRSEHDLNKNFIEVVSKLCPYALPILSIGFGEEEKFLASENIDKIFDVIVKPWSKEKIVHTINKAVEHNTNSQSLNRLSSNLEQKNLELENTLIQSKILLEKYIEVEKEIKSWVHPFVLRASEEKIKFPVYKDLSLLVVDIIDSGKLHLINQSGIDLRVKILQIAWEIVLKHGGEIESQEGDKLYANFGLSGDIHNLANAAIAAGKEFRSSLQAINDHYGTSVEVGIGIHFAKNCKINLRQSAINIDGEIIIRKKFDTSSPDVDLCHRMESLTHKLMGSNIALSKEVMILSTINYSNIREVGNLTLKGQQKATNIFLLPSNKVTEEEMSKFIEMSVDQYGSDKKAA